MLIHIFVWDCPWNKSLGIPPSMETLIPSYTHIIKSIQIIDIQVVNDCFPHNDIDVARCGFAQTLVRRLPCIDAEPRLFSCLRRKTWEIREISHGDFMGIAIGLMMANNYLVGGFNLPLWKIWVRQLVLLFPIYGKIKKCSKPPTSHHVIKINWRIIPLSNWLISLVIIVSPLRGLYHIWVVYNYCCWPVFKWDGFPTRDITWYNMGISWLYRRIKMIRSWEFP